MHFKMEFEATVDFLQVVERETSVELKEFLELVTGGNVMVDAVSRTLRTSPPNGSDRG